jgi:hypothetical protein
MFFIFSRDYTSGTGNFTHIASYGGMSTASGSRHARKHSAQRGRSNQCLRQTLRYGFVLPRAFTYSARLASIA